MREDRERLLDMQEAIEEIEKYAVRGKHAFERDELIQVWIIHHLQIIGEACRTLSQQFLERYSDGPWAKIIGMRNILVHPISASTHRQYGLWSNATCPTSNGRFGQS